MITKIQAIQTDFDGHLFRSRIEARWAAFYKFLGIPYEYEKEGFYLNGKSYLPDFWLPDQDCWVEIKGAIPVEEEENKVRLLADYSRKKVFIFFGGIPNPHPEKNGSSAYFYMYPFFYDTDYFWYRCVYCKKLAINREGRSQRFSCRTKKCPIDGNRDGTFDQEIIEAYNHARKQRFGR